MRKLWRRWRENKVNKQALPQVFGNSHTAMLGIPEVIDYYSNQMKGVDLLDQIIENYCPLLQNRQYWMALFMPGADIARINLSIVCKSQSKTQKESNRIKRSQKYVLTEQVEALKGQADVMQYGKTRQAAAMLPPASLCQQTRHRMSNTKPSLPIKRFRGNIAKHHRIPCPTEKQQQFIYCQFKMMKDKLDGMGSHWMVVETSQI